MQDWLGGNLDDRSRVLRREITAAELAEAQRVAEQARWDAAVTGCVAVLLCTDQVSVVDCTVAGGCIWVNLGGVLRQAVHGGATTTAGGGKQAQPPRIADCVVGGSPGCGLLVTGRKSAPLVERCTFRGCALAGVVAQQEGRPTLSECAIEDNRGYVQCIVVVVVVVVVFVLLYFVFATGIFHPLHALAH
jgi:hypothetical protein